MKCWCSAFTQVNCAAVYLGLHEMVVKEVGNRRQSGSARCRPFLRATRGLPGDLFGTYRGRSVVSADGAAASVEALRVSACPNLTRFHDQVVIVRGRRRGVRSRPMPLCPEGPVTWGTLRAISAAHRAAYAGVHIFIKFICQILLWSGLDLSTRLIPGPGGGAP